MTFRRITLSFLIGLALGCTFYGCSNSPRSVRAAVKPDKERKPAPDFSLKDADGKIVRLSDYKGKVVLLDFWATWCGPCKIEIPWLKDFQRKYKDKGFEILSVSLDDQKKDWKKAAAKDKITWMSGIDPGGWDAMAASKWQVDAIPASFLINKNGDVVAINLEKDELEKKIKELLGL